jgi:hypothetical protein
VQSREVTTRAGAVVDVQLRFEDEDGPGPYRYTILTPPKHGRLDGTDNDRTYVPEPGFVGEDVIAWKVNDGAADSEPARIVVRVEK